MGIAGCDGADPFPRPQRRPTFSAGSADVGLSRRWGTYFGRMASSASSHSGDPGAGPVGEAASFRVPAGGGPSRSGRELPLLDGAVLEELGEQLGRPDMAWNFARDYASMWGPRYRRLVASVERGDLVAALDAVLSLKVSSAMVGGLRLAHLAQMLEATVRKGDLRDGAALLAVIAAHGRATVTELQLRYIRTDG